MAETKHKDTVRGRKRSLQSTTQRYLPIAEIRNDTVLLKNGGIRAVIQVEALNFNLKSETEQQSIIAGYGAFMNTLTFPIQVSIRSIKTNIDNYLASISQLGEKQQNPLLKQQTLHYVNFIQQLLEVADIMQKHFYVIIPIDQTIRKKTLLEQFMDWLHPDDTLAKASIRNRNLIGGLKELNERSELVMTGLNNVGLHTRRLSTRELLILYYEIFNPKTSQHQKIPSDMNALGFVKAHI
jgi:hypothetical protein